MQRRQILRDLFHIERFFETYSIFRHSPQCRCACVNVITMSDVLYGIGLEEFVSDPRSLIHTGPWVFVTTKPLP
jgi:hypothetical protein